MIYISLIHCVVDLHFPEFIQPHFPVYFYQFNYHFGDQLYSNCYYFIIMTTSATVTVDIPTLVPILIRALVLILILSSTYLFISTSTSTSLRIPNQYYSIRKYQYNIHSYSHKHKGVLKHIYTLLTHLPI